jgi:type II secretory pathway pseudopilin PulG
MSGGFTLFEVLVAFSIASIVVLAVGAGFVFVTRAWTDQLGREQTQQSLRAAVETLTRELRLAGVCMPSGTLPPITSTYQPLAGTHGTTDTITVTSNPACAGPATVTVVCTACAIISVDNTTNFTSGTWAYIYDSTGTPTPYGESFLIQSVTAGSPGTVVVATATPLTKNYSATNSSLRGMDQRTFAISSTCGGCNGAPSLTLQAIGVATPLPLVKGIDTMSIAYVLNRLYTMGGCDGQTGGTSSLCIVNLPTAAPSIAGDWQLVRAVTFTLDARSTFPVRASGSADGYFHLGGAFEISPRNFMFQQSPRVPWTPY